MKYIAIIEDDIPIGDMVEAILKKEGYGVLRAYSGTEALLLLSQRHPDLILLDLMLPGLSGEEILPKLSGIPVIIVSAKAGIDDKVNLLLEGASDYITKPFSMDELLARMTAHLRREERYHTKTQGRFSEEMMIDYGKRKIYIKGSPVELSNKEFEIIKLLSRNAGQVFDKERIYEHIWGFNA